MKNVSLVYHLRGVKIARVLPDDHGASSASLPPALIIPPGIYNYRGQNYHLAQEGLYRFMCPPEDNQQRIVYRNDMLAMMSAVGWLHCHGSRDDHKSFDEVIALALTNKLVLTCGPYAKIVTMLFARLAVPIPIRTVGVRTLEERNGYSDGHILSEVRLDGRWIVFDVDQHLLYSFGGKRLSLLDLNPHVQARDYVREPLANGVSFAITDFKEGGYDYGLWYETAIARQDGEEFRRLMMIPIISTDGQAYYTAYTEAEHRRAEKLWADSPMHYLPIADFRARFYPGENIA